MKSKVLLTWAISLFLVLAALPLISACAGKPAGPVELKMAHIMPPKHVQHVKVMAPFAQEVEKATDGRVKITIYPGGALAKPPQMYDATVTGITDFGYVIQGYTAGKFPLTSVLELPFMFSSGEQGTKVFYDLYEKFPEIRQEYSEVKVGWLWTGDTGQLLMAKKPVHTLADLKGLKIRTHSAVLKKMLEAFGASPVAMPITEVYESLQKGVVDGVITPRSAIYDFSFYEVIDHLTIANFYVPAFGMFMNKDAFNRLSSKDQKTLDSMMGKPMGMKAAKVYDEAAQLGVDASKKAGVTIYTLPPAELAKWRQAAQPVYKSWVADMEAKGLPGQKVYDEAVRLAAKYAP